MTTSAVQLAILDWLRFGFHGGRGGGFGFFLVGVVLIGVLVWLLIGRGRAQN